MIKHILKNGEIKDSIDGYVVTKTQAPVVYEILNHIRKERKSEPIRARQDIREKRIS